MGTAIGTHGRLVAVLSIGLMACGTDGCWWTGDPTPEPAPAAELDRAYATDDGSFTVVLHGGDPWPPSPGVLPLRIEWSPPDPPPPMPRLTIARPQLVGDDLAAPTVPVAVAIDDRSWRIDALELDVPGRWQVELTLAQGELDDRLTLEVEVMD